MDSVERVKQICKKRKIPISKLERELNFANGYIGQLKKGSFPSDRLLKIAEYLNVPYELLLNGEEKTESPSEEAELLMRVRHDKALMAALEKYFKMTEEKKKHILNTIDVLSEVEK